MEISTLHLTDNSFHQPQIGASDLDELVSRILLREGKLDCLAVITCLCDFGGDDIEVVASCNMMEVIESEYVPRLDHVSSSRGNDSLHGLDITLTGKAYDIVNQCVTILDVFKVSDPRYKLDYFKFKISDTMLTKWEHILNTYE